MSASAKQTVQSAYSKLFPNAKNKDLFGSIDEKEIEKNIPLAESVIEKNKNANPLNRRTFENLPYLKPGLATFYTAAFSGNYEAANAARKLAYTEDAGVSLAEGISPQTQTTESNKRYVNADIGLNVRSEAGAARYAGEDGLRFYTDATTESENVALLSLGDEVLLLGEKKKVDDTEWAKVKYNDKVGWVKADYLKTEKSAAKGNAYEYLNKEITDADRKAGLKISEKDGKYYYDYTDVVMNRIKEVLPEFEKHRVESYEDFVDKSTPKNLYDKHYTNGEYQGAVLSKLLFFYQQVTHEAPWDIKRANSWKMQFGDVKLPYYSNKNDSEKFLFAGELVSREDLGNITYGYLGSAMGLGELTLFWGAGVAQNWYDAIFKGKAYDPENNYGDRPEDHDFVKKGIQMYYEDYPDAKPGINRTLP
ncbi:MAG: hypothetical protein E7621_05595 [Ruminococcaceae bacterium]|nr:hypothetical protein [Oscillospiraceae bacterium]